MSHRICAAALAVAAAVCGCTSTGLSPREVPGRTQSAYLYSLYDDLAPAGDDAGGADGAAVYATARPLRLPAAVAVAQVGEVAPPQPMLDALRSDPLVFARVIAIPGTGPHEPYSSYARSANDAASTERAAMRRSVSALRRLAADAGAEQLLLVGGTIDHHSAGTPLSLLDLTIVGAFVVPSRETRATARASAALIDVRTGRVLQTSAAEARRQSLVPAGSVDAEQPKLLEALRDDVVTKLGAQVVADLRARAAVG